MKCIRKKENRMRNAAYNQLAIDRILFSKVFERIAKNRDPDKTFAIWLKAPDVFFKPFPYFECAMRRLRVIEIQAFNGERSFASIVGDLLICLTIVWDHVADRNVLKGTTDTILYTNWFEKWIIQYSNLFTLHPIIRNK